MPELPEVETIANQLRNGTGDQPKLVGLTIAGADVFWERTLAEPTLNEFAPRLIQQSVRDIGRRGKFLVFHLSQDYLLVHLRMSGDLIVEPSDAPKGTHYRMVIEFEGGRRLAFNDPRKFGRVWLVDEPRRVIGSLGPEPLDSGFSADEFYNRLRQRRRQLKPLLLDQTFLAGVGNIYADEALHLARLHPQVSADLLNFHQAERLLKSIRQVLEEGIRRSGASIDWVYRGGNFQNYFRAYHREGNACPVCGNPIQRIVVGQRGTHYCATCQQLP